MEQKTVTAKQKSKKFTAYAAIMAALALAIAIPLNLLASRLNVVWDMTPTGLYELSDTTRNFLSSLDKQVNFYFLMDMDVLSTDDNSMALYHSLQEYASYDNINFVDFEPDSDPDLTKKLQDEGYRLSRGDMVIECEGRSKHIQGINMYQFMTSTNDSGNTVVEEAYFTGENYITGAIDAVVSGRDTVIYFVAGHGEKTIENDYTTLNTNLQNRNYITEELILSTAGAVPDDAAIVIFAAPKSDISNDERRMIDEYLENGGNVCFWMSPNQEEFRYKNIEAILDEFSLAMDYDIVSETDSSLHISGDPYTYRVNVVASEDELDLTSGVIDMVNAGAIPFMSNSRSFYAKMGAEDTSVATGSLLQTVPSTNELGSETSTAVGEPYGGDDAMAEEVSGQVLDLAMYATSTLKNDAKVMVMGNAEFIDDVNVAQDYMIVPVNLMLSVFSWMYDSDVDMDMGIADKERSYDTMVMNSEQEANRTSVIFMVVPFVVAIAGAGVWLGRRYS